MPFTPKLTYKGKPLVRKDNELYYGRMTDPLCTAYADLEHQARGRDGGGR